MLIQTVYTNTGVNRRELTSYFIVMPQKTYVIPVRIDRKPYHSFKSSKMVTKQDVPNQWKKKQLEKKYWKLIHLNQFLTISNSH